MNFLHSLLNIEEVNYTSKLNQKRLNLEIEKFFQQDKLTMEGEVSSPNKFSANDKKVVIAWIMPNLKRKAAYLSGVISKHHNGSLIKLTVKPNTILPIFAILSIITGLILTLSAIANYESNNYLLFIALFVLLIGTIYYPMSAYFKNKLRNQFVKHLDLQRL